MADLGQVLGVAQVNPQAVAAAGSYRSCMGTKRTSCGGQGAGGCAATAAMVANTDYPNVSAKSLNMAEPGPTDRWYVVMWGHVVGVFNSW